MAQYVGGFQAGANNANVYRRRGELYSVSVDESVDSGDVVDIVIENPSGSGKRLEVLLWQISVNGEAKVTLYRDNSFYTGTATEISPKNYKDSASDSTSFNSEFANGTPTQLIDTGTVERFNGGIYSSSSQGGVVTGSLGSRPQIDVTVAEGNSLGLQVEGIQAVDSIIALVVAEYEKGRNLGSEE